MSSRAHFAAIAEQLSVGARVLSVRRLTGGVSADVHALELEDASGGRRTVVVRQPGAAEWKPRHARVAAMEHDVLAFLHASDLPVPQPLLLDARGALLSRPCLVTTFVDGSAEVPDEDVNGSLDIMANTLARLHALPTVGLPELPCRLDPLPELYDYLPDTAEWEPLRTFLSLQPATGYRQQPVLLHGDFWPGNLLWQRGRLVAVLDWEDAAVGDPMSDVAGCRLELLWKYGERASDRFTRAYTEQHSVAPQRLALWEVYVGCAAARFMATWGLAPARETEMRRLTSVFIRRAARLLLTYRADA